MQFITGAFYVLRKNFFLIKQILFNGLNLRKVSTFSKSSGDADFSDLIHKHFTVFSKWRAKYHVDERNKDLLGSIILDKNRDVKPAINI